MYQRNNPTTIEGTRRQRVVTKSGAVLERQYIFLSAQDWDSLQQICEASRRSHSQAISSLINIAAHVSNRTENADVATQ